MSYSAETFRRVRLEFEEKRNAAIRKADARREALYAQSPELDRIDRVLTETGFRIFEAAREGKEGLDSRIAALRRETTELRAARAMLLRDLGYPETYTDPAFECADCQDTGYCGISMCTCMRRALAAAGIERAGFSHAAETQTFESFDLRYYPSPRDAATMKQNLEQMRTFAETFDPKKTAQNLLLLGPTGLGKTHLSTAAALRIIERGYDVIYESAETMFDTFARDRFHGNGSGEESERYFTCDLLVLDDLGTELTNQFTVSCLYQVINIRLQSGKSTLINTNLSEKELRERYADRITSRLFGEFRPLLFSGNDIRLQKLRGNL